MGVKKFVVNIEGDYVDSYIYSGYLILVDANYMINIFKWERVFSDAFSGLGQLGSITFQNLLKDGRKKIPDFQLSTVTIRQSSLAAARVFVQDVGVWPSDINVYSNKLYVSSEKGLSAWDLDYRTGGLSGEIKIYGEMSFTISPNSFGRLAFAAGKEGVFTFVPVSKFAVSRDVKQIISGSCLDLDWQSTLLSASMENGVVEAAFVEMPLKAEFDKEKDFFSAVKEVKKNKPQLNCRKEIQSSWIGGDKKYSFFNSGVLEVQHFSRDEPKVINTFALNEKVLRARTAAFGTVVETEEKLYALVGTSKQELAVESIGWRVFPRAKNYANQLHVIHEERIEITIIESVESNDFGFDPEMIDLRG